MIRAGAPVVSRPLSIGEIFDRVVTLLVRRGRAVLVLALASAVPTVLGELVEAYAPGSGGAVLLRILGGLMSIYGGAAILLLIAGLDDRPDPLRLLRDVFARFLGLFGAAFVTNMLNALVGGTAFAIAAAVVRAGVVAGALVGVALFAVVAPMVFAFELGFAIAVLEDVGGIEGVRRAWRRTMRNDRGRTWRLAFAALAAGLGPVFVLDSAIEMLAKLPGLRWTPGAAALVETMTAFVFFNAVLAVASIDYRVRQEGLDLEAVLDAQQPA